MSLYNILFRLLRRGAAGALLLSPTLLWAKVDVGTAFPQLTSFSLEGAAPTPAGKVTLIDFWASWCAPCKTSFPALSKLKTGYGDDVVILGVSIDDKASAYTQFLAHYKPTFSTVRDGKQQLVAAVEVPTMPTSYLLDRHGVVRFIHVGFHDNTPAELHKEIDQLLKESP